MSYEFQGTCIEVLQLCWCDFCQENVTTYRILLSKMCINKLFYAPVKSSRKTMWKLTVRSRSQMIKYTWCLN